MSEFYRFLRPQEYNLQRNSMQTKPNGGICFKVKPEMEWEGQRVVTLSFSMCPLDELFNRDVAKKIASQSATWNILVDSLSTEGIAIGMLREDANHIIDTPNGIYHQLQLRKLQSEIQHIHRVNKLATDMAISHTDAIKALQLGKRYHDIQQ